MPRRLLGRRAAAGVGGGASTGTLSSIAVTAVSPATAAAAAASTAAVASPSFSASSSSSTISAPGPVQAVVTFPSTIAAASAALPPEAATASADLVQLGGDGLPRFPHDLHNLLGDIPVVVIQARVGVSLLAGSASASDSVHIILLVRRRVVVHHDLDVLDVQPSLRNVRGYQDLGFAGLERPERVVSLPLLHVSVKRHDRRACAGQRRVQPGRRALRLGEDQHCTATRLQLREDLVL
mmetsp:Transcript_54858/g.141453  ORF Transcript_54858/g.141453 Transcript_54858/m.141453 type:complete len:238 (-) Transcript_54858:945-1658(-)